MKSRFIKNIKVKGNRLKFEHSDLHYDCVYTSDSVEAIYYNGTVLRFHPSKSSSSSHVCSATEQDFEIMKKLLSTSQDFIKCGENYIFSLENITSYDGNGSTLSVSCKNKSYKVHKMKEEAIKDFINAVQRKLPQEAEAGMVD